MAEKIPKTKIEWEIVKLVREIRNAKKVSQAKLAKMLGVTSGYIGQIEIENSPSMYTYDQLNKLATGLECSLKDFMPEKPIKIDFG
ncbi:helix-turn-helix domain-containing protein [Sphingobacterium multivorum]|uniref:helix-turn-helix domain-containing protein n=1 Tax=Sphingobacterium multivorum TaxID=28454 RepID=UPI000E9CF5A0|nr:helix-turn-helix transcriptional regulator [Sphingobacterium multivorum]HAU52271.1 transcriptional regulator [Sphingobacterium sp.]HBW81432.1 transcriptional regulator [Sphingobacterium sp.]